MTENTGGHYLDTGDGPKPLTILTGNALESPVSTAWRAYLDHRPHCADCMESTYRCATANALWAAYTDTRGEL